MLRLKILREKKGLSQSEVARELNISRQSYNFYENGKREPDNKMVKKLADYFGVTTDFLLDMPEQKKTPVKGVKIPVLGTIIAGVPIEAVTNIIGYEEIHPDLAKTGEFFGLKVKGDSMSPKIDEGDIVIVRKQPNVENGEIAVVIINGEEATLKKVKKREEGIVLEAFNPFVFPPKFYSWEDIGKLPVEILGKVVQSMRMW